jgi:allantoate deiminase
MPKMTLARAAATLSRRIDLLARVSDERGGTTRTFLSPAMRRANALVAGWMKGAGLSVREDSLGNLIGRTRAPTAGRRTLILGSHLDTVRDAGRFDGPLGVLLPIAAIEMLRSAGVSLPFDVEVVGFSEEEGVRFSGSYLGSKGFAGRLRKADLRLRDSKGMTVGQVLLAHNRGRFSIPGPAHSRSELIGYLEVHIEQGPVLESKGLAAGVVSAISGQTRGTITFGGHAGHAGTTPMRLRSDALAGAAEFIVAVERLARSHAPLVATVGRISAHPGSSNVIAGSAELSLDVRHPSDAKRRAALRSLVAAGRAIAGKRGLSFSFARTQDNDAVECSAELTALLSRSVRARQGRSVALASGAGHDAVVVSAIAPVAMLFVRCRKGLSHHPDEFVAPRDIAAALGIVVDFLGRMAARSPR